MAAQFMRRARSNANQKLTDEQIVQARKSHELNEVPCADIASHFGVEDSYMRRILNYAIKGRLYIEDHPGIEAPAIGSGSPSP